MTPDPTTHEAPVSAGAYLCPKEASVTYLNPCGCWPLGACPQCTPAQPTEPAPDARNGVGGVEVALGANEARKWTLTVPANGAAFINLNQRMHWAPKAELTRRWRMFTAAIADVEKLPKGLARVHIVAHVTKPTARQYDVHNLMPTLKACVDGLVDYGLIADDTNAHLIGPDLRQGGKGQPGVTITITEELE